jgi:hypothetical protein
MDIDSLIATKKMVHLTIFIYSFVIILILFLGIFLKYPSEISCLDIHIEKYTLYLKIPSQDILKINLYDTISFRKKSSYVIILKLRIDSISKSISGNYIIVSYIPLKLMKNTLISELKPESVSLIGNQQSIGELLFLRKFK